MIKKQTPAQRVVEQQKWIEEREQKGEYDKSNGQEIRQADIAELKRKQSLVK